MSSSWHLQWNSWTAAWFHTMAHTCLQGGLFILSVWLLCRLIPRLPVALRGSLWWLACLKLVVGLVWVQPLLLKVLPASSPSQPQTMLEFRARPIGSEPMQTASKHRLLITPFTPVGEQAFDNVPIIVPTQEAAVPLPSADPKGLYWPVVLLGMWLSGLMVGSVGLCRQFMAARRLLQGATALQHPSITEAATRVAAALGFRPCPKILVSCDVVSPVVLGLTRSVVLLPQADLDRLSSQQSTMVLAHEMAHLRRGDLWLSLIPVLARWLFWFHPLVWPACHEFTLCREAACDTDALRVSGAPADAYGQLLLTYVPVGARRQITGGLCVASGCRPLQRRLSMLEYAAPISPFKRRVSLICVMIVAVVCLIPWRVIAVPQSPVDSPQVTIHRHLTFDQAFQALGNAAGVKIEFDPIFLKADHRIRAPQSVDLQETNAPLEKALQDLLNQAGTPLTFHKKQAVYTIVYDETRPPKPIKIPITLVMTQPFDQALTQLFRVTEGKAVYEFAPSVLHAKIYISQLVHLNVNARPLDEALQDLLDQVNPPLMFRFKATDVDKYIIELARSGKQTQIAPAPLGAISSACVNAPFDEAIDSLFHNAGARYRIAPTVLASNEPVSYDVHDATLDGALKALLDALHGTPPLTYHVERGIYEITPQNPQQPAPANPSDGDLVTLTLDHAGLPDALSQLFKQTGMNYVTILPGKVSGDATLSLQKVPFSRAAVSILRSFETEPTLFYRVEGGIARIAPPLRFLGRDFPADPVVAFRLKDTSVYDACRALFVSRTMQYTLDPRLRDVKVTLSGQMPMKQAIDTLVKACPALKLSQMNNFYIFSYSDAKPQR